MTYYQITKLKENVYRFTSLENVFFELLVGKEKALLIDTGNGFGNIREAVRSITDKPLLVANTHGHVDHTSGNCQFEEPVYIAKEDLDLLCRHNTAAFREHSVRLQEHVRDWVTGQELYGLPEDFQEQAYIEGAKQYDSVRKDLKEKAQTLSGQYHLLREGMIFDLGGITLRTIATPGHTKGSMSFLYEEENWLYVGDAANPFLWLFDQDAADRDTLIASYDKILALHPERIYGGHAPMPFSQEDVRQFKRAAVEADYDRGVPFSTPLMPEIKDIRVCILDGKTMADIGTPGYYSILIDSSRK